MAERVWFFFVLLFQHGSILDDTRIAIYTGQSILLLAIRGRKCNRAPDQSPASPKKETKQKATSPGGGGLHRLDEPEAVVDRALAGHCNISLLTMS
ncbi:hypothetical protein B0T17DRAFT_304604 [Bombardia bombarda]|uniref:Secreted protein n=1 Tax=Bombardia bombarda TaxID=252184 RepID=A0AA39WUG1_9PEZI|nr:hypothetical protein B0T17DRAFT_304604 [Bombardia bombarda]